MAAVRAAKAHAMSIDVEEHFQVWALANHYRRPDWEDLPSRVESSTDRLLDSLARHQQRATFFTLGWVARRHGPLIRRIVDQGHEVASHGLNHDLVYDLSPDAFRADVRESREILQQQGGQPVIGYRAPSFSLGKATPWAHEILADEGYQYSSSSHPVANDHYGPGAKNADPLTIDGVLEIPVSTLPLPLTNTRLPCAGGGYFRLLPSFWTAWSLRFLDRKHADPIMFYLHPWEVDPAQPRPDGLTWKTKIRHYCGLKGCLSRFDGLLNRFDWRPIDELYGFRTSRI